MIRTEAAAPPDFSESELFESALEFHHGQQYGIDANARVKDNLRKEAEARGIDPARLVFAPRTWLAQHLARHRQADLFLDTLPYNAHTTTSDALWAGLPVVTVLGETFAGRVAASLLNAVGLPLITQSVEDYEALALKLARTPGLLAQIRRKLNTNRLKAPLFDTQRYARHLEAAYRRMWEIWAEGGAAEAFAVTPLEKSAPAQRVARQAYEACPFCGSHAHKAFLNVDCSGDPASRDQLAPRVEWHRCEDCEHVFAAGYFAAEAVSATAGSESVGHEIEAGRLAAAPLVGAVAQHVGALNCDDAWLDVGFGNGSLLFTAAEWGFASVGLDARAGQVAALQDLGFEAHQGALESLDAPDHDDFGSHRSKIMNVIDSKNTERDLSEKPVSAFSHPARGRFGIVSLVDQLPRQIDPAKALAATHRLLRQDGLLLLRLPNADSAAFHLLESANNPYWRDIGRYHMFGRKRLYALLREGGFRPLEYRVSTQLRAGMDVIARRTT